jgi:hypothetical protein
MLSVYTNATADISSFRFFFCGISHFLFQSIVKLFTRLWTTSPAAETLSALSLKSGELTLKPRSWQTATINLWLTKHVGDVLFKNCS